MPIKRAFTLIEITIVILLMGVLYSLVLSKYTKQVTLKSQNIEDIPSFIQKSGHTNGSLYIYGDFCQKGVFIDNKSKVSEISNFNYPKDGVVLKTNASDRFTKNEFEDIRIDKKNRQLCFFLKYKNGKFSQKEIIAFRNRWYLLSPFWQKIKKFDSLEKAKIAYRNSTLYPQSEDDYYHE